MTARDEAIDAMNSEMTKFRYWKEAETIQLPATILDAIPGDVLVRLAIERGALKWVEVGVPDDTGRVFVTDGEGFYKELDEYESSVLWQVEP